MGDSLEAPDLGIVWRTLPEVEGKTEKVLTAEFNTDVHEAQSVYATHCLSILNTITGPQGEFSRAPINVVVIGSALRKLAIYVKRLDIIFAHMSRIKSEAITREITIPLIVERLGTVVAHITDVKAQRDNITSRIQKKAA